MKKHLFKISVIALMLFSNWGCRKDESMLVTDELKELKSFYNQNKPDATSIFKNTSPKWTEVVKLETDGFAVYEVNLDNPDRVGLMSNISKTTEPAQFEQTHGLKMLLFVDGNGKVNKGCYMAVEASIPAELTKVHYKKAGGLNGNVIYYKLDGTMSNGVVYVEGKAKHRISYLPESEILAIKNGDGSRMVQGCTMRYIETGYYYCVFTPYSENCGWQSTGYAGFPVCDNVGLNYADSQVEQGFEGGGGTAMTMPPPPDRPILDIKKFLSCFDKTKSANLTIYAAKMFSSSASGHAFISITQGANIMTFGFYPKNEGTSQILGTGVMGDDSGHAYSYAWNAGYISPSELSSIIDKAIYFSNTDYNIAYNNCADFALIIFGILGMPQSLSGLDTPDTVAELIRLNATSTNGNSPQTQRNCK